jgi:hypothetical protein
MLILLAQLLCLCACLLRLLGSSKLQERFAHSRVSRGIRGIQCECLFVGAHCLFVAAEFGKDTTHAHRGGRKQREYHRLLEGGQCFVVELEPNECTALAWVRDGIGALLAQRLFISMW